MKTLPYIAALTFIAAILNPGILTAWEWLTFSGLIAGLWLLLRISSHKQKETAQYRRAYWRRYQYNKQDEEI